MQYAFRMVYREPKGKKACVTVRDNINFAVLSFVERLASIRGSQCNETIIQKRDL